MIPPLRPITFFAPISLLTLALSLTACRTAPPEQEHKPLESSSTTESALPSELRVNAALIESGRIVLSVAQAPLTPGGSNVPGEVVSATDGAAEVGALVPGRVAALEVNAGDRVKKGQVLAWIDSAEVAAARADLASCSVTRDLEQSRLERQEALEKEGATAQSTIDAARSAFRAAEASCAAAMLRLTTLGASGGSGARYALLAPIEGVVVERNSVLGAAVRPEQLLFRIVSPERVLIVARFPEHGMALPAPETMMQISLRGGASSGTCQAKVETNSDVVDPHTRTILVRLRPQSDCTQLRPGAYVEVRAQSPAKKESPDAGQPHAVGGALVPARAVVQVRGTSTVFVADRTPGTFHARSVVIGRIDGDSALIEQGVSPGESVASEGTILLKGEMMRDVLGGE